MNNVVFICGSCLLVLYEKTIFEPINILWCPFLISQPTQATYTPTFLIFICDETIAVQSGWCVVTFCNLALTYTCHFLLQFVIWSKDDTQTFIFCQTITTSLLSSTLPLQASLFTCQLTCWTTHHHQLTWQACQYYQTACQTTHNSQCSCHSTHCYRVTCQTTHNC